MRHFKQRPRHLGRQALVLSDCLKCGDRFSARGPVNRICYRCSYNLIRSVSRGNRALF